MSRNRSRNLYDLIKSMNKNEKRHFKMFASSGNQDDKKILLLFDAINKINEFNEDQIIKKIPSIKIEQLSNLKAYLFDKILQSLRQFNSGKIIDIQIREQIDFAQLLFERRLYNSGMNCLKKAKKLAQEHNHLELQLEIIKLEKSVLMLIMQEDPSRPDQIINEVKQINSQITLITLFSNLIIKLNSYYTKIGFIRNESDYDEVKKYFYDNLPTFKEKDLSITEKIYLYKLFVGYYLFIQDFENGYLYSNKLYQLFEENEILKETNTEAYITALNTLLTSQYKLSKYQEFINTNQKLHAISNNPKINISESMRIRLIKYYFIHEINQYFMTGDFELGIKEIIEKRSIELDDLFSKLDKHSTMIMNYKLACLFIGASKFNMGIRYLNKIINEQNIDFREDLHCFSRILALVCHYELGNFDVIKYYIISTYRFLFKKDDLHLFQKYILSFLKNLNQQIDTKELISRFQKLKLQLKDLENSPYEKRAFIYFDIISWLESKIEKKPIQEIMMGKLTLKD